MSETDRQSRVDAAVRCALEAILSAETAEQELKGKFFGPAADAYFARAVRSKKLVARAKKALRGRNGEA